MAARNRIQGRAPGAPTKSVEGGPAVGNAADGPFFAAVEKKNRPSETMAYSWLMPGRNSNEISARGFRNLKREMAAQGFF